MKQLEIATFRQSPAGLSEPVEVTRYGRPVGVWIPIATPALPLVLAACDGTLHRVAPLRLPSHGRSESPRPITRVVRVR